MLKYSVLLLMLFLPLASPLAAEQNLQSVRALVESGKADQAYQALLADEASHQQDANYYYDLGTLAYQLGKTGPAVAFLEKADHLKRHDPDIQHNLELARTSLAQTIGQDRLDAASTWSESLADHVSLEEIRGVLGLLLLTVSGFWIRGYLKTRKIQAALLGPAALICSVGLLGVGSLYSIERFAKDRPPAVCLTKAPIRSGPGENYAELTQLDSGAKIRLLGLTDKAAGTEWYQIRYSQEGIGWVRAPDVLVVN